MLNKKTGDFFLLWIFILFLGKNEIISYWHRLTNQEDIIRSYIDTCVLDFPFSFCRLVYNKLTFGIPERILSLLSPLSIENILLQAKSIVLLLLFPAYLIGIFSLFIRFHKYLLFTLIVFTTLLINLLLHVSFFFTFLSLPIIFGIGIVEIYVFVKKHI